MASLRCQLPDPVVPGQQVIVTLDGRKFSFKAPANAHPGMVITLSGLPPSTAPPTATRREKPVIYTTQPDGLFKCAFPGCQSTVDGHSLER